MDDDIILEELEIDIEIAQVEEILTSHGVKPTDELVWALWQWMEANRFGTDT